jgi:hypothetical protein
MQKKELNRCNKLEREENMESLNPMKMEDAENHITHISRSCEGERDDS